MAHYLGIIHQSEGGTFGVSFPDFPGCVTAAYTLDALPEMAREALEFHMQGMQEDGEALPEPMTLAEAKAHELAADADLFMAFEASPPSRPVRVNVMLDSDLLDQIAKVSSNRSEFLSNAAWIALNKVVDDKPFKIRGRSQKTSQDLDRLRQALEECQRRINDFWDILDKKNNATDSLRSRATKNACTHK